MIGPKRNEFCEIWNRAISIHEVVHTTGMSENVAFVRAARYRRQGEKLKNFQHSSALIKRVRDWSAFKNLIA